MIRYDNGRNDRNIKPYDLPFSIALEQTSSIFQAEMFAINVWTQKKTLKDPLDPEEEKNEGY